MTRAMTGLDRALAKDAAARRRELRNIARRVDRLRDKAGPAITTGLARFVHMMANELRLRGKFHPIDEDPEHCALAMFVVLDRMWRLEIERRDKA